MHELECRLAGMDQLCTSCSGLPPSAACGVSSTLPHASEVQDTVRPVVAGIPCTSFDCPVVFLRARAQRDALNARMTLRQLERISLSPDRSTSREDVLRAAQARQRLDFWLP